MLLVFLLPIVAFIKTSLNLLENVYELFAATERSCLEFPTKIVTVWKPTRLYLNVMSTNICADTACLYFYTQ